MSPVPMDVVFLTDLRAQTSEQSFSNEAQVYLLELAKQLQSDFTSPEGGYFSLEQQSAIASESARRLAQAISLQSSAVSTAWLQGEWRKIVVDFYQNAQWGHTPQKNRPPKILNEDQKRTRELAPYIWAAFQAWIVMKVIIYYFGTEAADHPDEPPWFLYLAMAFSFGSLAFFAWRKYLKDGKND